MYIMRNSQPFLSDIFLDKERYFEVVYTDRNGTGCPIPGWGLISLQLFEVIDLLWSFTEGDV